MKFLFRKENKADRLIDILEGAGQIAAKLRKEFEEPKTETQPNALLDLIRKAQTIEELDHIYSKYEQSLSFSSAAALIVAKISIKLDSLEKRVGLLEKDKHTGE